jgi:hypothetical protein
MRIEGDDGGLRVASPGGDSARTVAIGVTFDKVVFDNTNTTSSGFESDNHTVFDTPVTLSGDHAFVTNLPLAAPEPSDTLLIGAGLLLIAVGLRLKGVAPRTH